MCVCVCVCVCVCEEEEEGGDVGRQTYHPRSPPVNSGGQTISLIEFNPASPQEAPRLVAPLSMERVGEGGGGGGKRVCVCVYMRIDRMRRRRRRRRRGFSWHDK